jgi:hypothetical protein
MEKMKTLRKWQELPPQMIAISGIKTDDALQPRCGRVVPLKDQHRVVKMSKDHVTRLCVALQGGKDEQLEPLLVADVDSVLYLVDGHHRLKAYERVKRRDVPVRILRITKAEAVRLSKLVNVTGTKLPMTREQAAEACWQTIADLTLGGRTEAGMSLREIAALFGVGKDTVAAMLQNVKAIKLSEFGPAACDPGTGWPLWKYVKQSKWRPPIEVTDAKQRLAMQVEKDAAQLAAFRDKLGPARAAAAVRLLLKEAKEAEGQDFWEDVRLWNALQEPVVY